MKKMKVLEAVRAAMDEEMERDENVFLIGEDIGVHGGVFLTAQGLHKKFGPRRVRQTPISEAGIIGTAIGSALTGLRPIADIMYIDFTGVCMDQIANQAAKLRYMSGGQVKLPLVIRTQGGTGTGEAAQHTQSLEAWFVHVPGLKVVMPSNAADAKGLLKSAIRDDNPVTFIEHKLMYKLEGDVPDGEHLVPLGVAAVPREGTDVTVIATSLMVSRALAVAEQLEGQVSVEVVDPRTLVPLDIDTIAASVSKTGRVLIVQEACERGGFASELVKEIQWRVWDDLEAPIEVLAGKNIPIPYSPPLEQAAVPQEKDIKAAILQRVSGVQPTS